jgi:uncharacterized integral membrane protein
MATVRLVIVLLILGVVVLLAVQNTAPALPLIVFGGQTVALPLGVWLVIAIALGALTTLAFTALLGASGGQGKRSRAYKYRAQPFYEPRDSNTAAREVAEEMSSRSSSSSRTAQSQSPRDDQRANDRTYGREWQDWTNLQSGNPANNWEAVEQAAQSRQGPPTEGGARDNTGGGIGSWLFGQRKAAETEQVNQSWQELSDDWGEQDYRDYRARGVSPVDESLDDINQGWAETQDYGASSRDFEVPQSPKRVYQDGSLYSYSYHHREGEAQRDNIYAPPDDAIYGDEGFDRDAYIDLSQPQDYTDEGEQVDEPAPYGSDDYGTQDLGEPEIAEDGVVDADYRVIIPPSPPSDAVSEAPATADEKETWNDNPDDEDDWSDAEDALTP